MSQEGMWVPVPQPQRPASTPPPPWLQLPHASSQKDIFSPWFPKEVVASMKMLLQVVLCLLPLKLLLLVQVIPTLLTSPSGALGTLVSALW